MRRTLQSTVAFAAAALLATMLPGAGLADTVPVPLGQSIQDAIDNATAGDRIELEIGTYDEDITFGGKAVHVVGAGPGNTVIRGTGTGPVVTFDSGEGPDSILDSVTVTGGAATRGGGVLIQTSSPTVIRCWITENSASAQGSGVFVGGDASPRIFNNLITYNVHTGSGDPHAIEVIDATPAVVNNTIVRNDSNGLITRGTAAPLVLNNIFAWNGSKVGKRKRGRGICDFTPGSTVILYNNFHKNRIAAVLREGRDWKKVKWLDRNNFEDPDIGENRDGNPRFNRKPKKNPDKMSYDDFGLKPKSRNAKALNRGHPDDGCSDLSGGQNSMGHTGGPFAPGSEDLPGDDYCGILLP